MAFRFNSSNLRNESINSFWFSLSIRENPWVSSIRLKSSFPPLKRVVIYFSRGNSPLSSKMEYNWFPFPYIPHRNNNFVFSYNNRMLLIQGAYKRQKADRTGSGFGNGTAGHIRFICQVIAFGSCWGHRPKTDYRWHVPMYSCTVSLHLWYRLLVLSANHW